MSHVPERPREFVCENCHLIYVGTTTGGEGTDRHYEPPTECAACGSTSFVELDAYPHTQ
ncbi:MULTISPECIES: hypothetical protein [Haloprofundus]|uniref:hypothetical protein n=1 Tax=Haloprofundus TaxID=1911573 RepID=UPI00143CCE77|nr:MULTISPECIES: hypothetical protein [Haloprofundus]